MTWGDRDREFRVSTYTENWDDCIIEKWKPDSAVCDANGMVWATFVYDHQPLRFFAYLERAQKKRLSKKIPRDEMELFVGNNDGAVKRKKIPVEPKTDSAAPVIHPEL